MKVFVSMSSFFTGEKSPMLENQIMHRLFAFQREVDSVLCAVFFSQVVYKILVVFDFISYQLVLAQGPCFISVITHIRPPSFSQIGYLSPFVVAPSQSWHCSLNIQLKWKGCRHKGQVHLCRKIKKCTFFFH